MIILIKFKKFDQYSFKIMNIIYVCLYSISVFLLDVSIIRVNGQVKTPCTSSIITTTYTPCFNIITGSSRSNRSSSPTKNCCRSIKSFVRNNLDCACLIVTGNVPIPLISQNLAISLPRICNGGLPIQCKASGAPLPAPGPALFAPPPPPAIVSPAEAPSNSVSPAPEPKPKRASKAITLAPTPPPDEEPGSSPAASVSEPSSPATHQKIKPVLNPKSASSPSRYMLSPSILIIFTIIIVLEYQ